MLFSCGARGCFPYKTTTQTKQCSPDQFFALNLICENLLFHKLQKQCLGLERNKNRLFLLCEQFIHIRISSAIFICHPLSSYQTSQSPNISEVSCSICIWKLKMYLTFLFLSVLFKLGQHLLTAHDSIFIKLKDAKFIQSEFDCWTFASC